MKRKTSQTIKSIGLWILILGIPILLIIGDVKKEPTCETENINYSELDEYSAALPIGESVVVRDGVDGKELVCINDNREVVSSTVTVEPISKVTHNGTGSIPEDRDGEYSEAEYISDYEDNGIIEGYYFGDYIVAEYEPVYTAPSYSYRTGAVCSDGTPSSATGRGACSWHGGVSYWLYN